MKKILSVVVLLLVTTVLFAKGDRSPEWPKVRAQFLKTAPVCEICGSKKDVQVHHIKPFHLYPDMELDPNNLVTVCISKYWGFNCHFAVAHGGSYHWENPWVVEDIKKMHVIAAPDYIRKNGTKERDDYLKFIFTRVKEYNQ